MQQDTFVYKCISDGIQEIFVTAVGNAESPGPSQAEAHYQKVLQIMTQEKAVIFQERIFGTQTGVIAAHQARNRVLQGQTDPVAPSLLVGSPGVLGDYFGIQVHLIVAPDPAQVLQSGEGLAVGRLVKTPQCQYVGLSGLTAATASSVSEQARAMFTQANDILKELDHGFKSVPRTWLWLKDILDWYDELNAVRNTFFTECGILGTSERHPMPASTGIGLGPANGRACAMDLTAVLNQDAVIEYHQAGGKQESAYEYGSAFSRAASVRTPGGKSAFISGTASIDKAGLTTNLGNPKAQIEQTIVNVIAVLYDMKFTEKDVVQVMGYCKTPEIHALFQSMQKPDWPWVSMVCDVCRDDLLFETEALAIKQV